MKYTIIFAILLTGLLHHKQTINPPTISWDTTKNWKLYIINDFHQVFRIPEDSLQYLQYKKLSDDTVHQMLSDAQKIDSGSPLWMGCYLASYETPGGKLRKVVISVYGGFFYTTTDRTYYQVNDPIKNDWLTYISDSYMRIPQ